MKTEKKKLPLMLAQPFERHRVTTFEHPVLVQPKLDGLRARYYQGHFYSRDGVQYDDKHVEHLLPKHIPNDVMVDGEFYAHGMSLQEINSVIGVKRTEPHPRRTFIMFVAFDVWLYDTTKQNHLYSQRFSYLAHLVSTSIMWALVPTWTAHNHADLDEKHKQCVTLGYEGSMIRLNGVYQNKRSFTLMKRKDFIDDTFRVVGKVEGTGKYTNMLGAITCVTSNGEHFTVGSGISDEQRETWWYHIPFTHAKVKFQTLTKAGIPRHPTLISPVQDGELI